MYPRLPPGMPWPLKKPGFMDIVARLVFHRTSGTVASLKEELGEAHYHAKVDPFVEDMTRFMERGGISRESIDALMNGRIVEFDIALRIITLFNALTRSAVALSDLDIKVAEVQREELMQSWTPPTRKMRFMELRDRRYFQITDLARLAGTDEHIVYFMLLNDPVPYKEAIKVIDAYNRLAGTKYTIDHLILRFTPLDDAP